ncbi:MAG: ArsA family ATPase [Actinobacteria bacterium]|nr:ArsA family ATPase [Actinomycetota bacterium]
MSPRGGGGRDSTRDGTRGGPEAREARDGHDVHDARKVRAAGTNGGDRARTLERLLATKEIVVSCGSGGVGKTTMAAALAAMAATHLGGKVLVLTVDPARRLANALGLERFGNTEVVVPPEAFAAGGVEPRGALWAAMLDTKQSWDDLVRRHAPDARTRDAILSNALYENISGRFVQSHDYIAMERLFEIHSSGTYDLIVVDTPPTRNAIDFLEAPERMGEFFSSRLLRWLTAPAKSRVLTVTSKPFYRVADSILGSQFLGDIAEFFSLFQTMAPGFVERSGAVKRLLTDRRTTFLVVSTLEAAPAREAEFFVRELDARGLHLGAVILNKVLPTYLRRTNLTPVARALCRDAAALAADPSVHGGDEPDQVARVLQEVGESFLNYQVVAKRESEQRDELAQIPDVVATAPYLEADVHDLAGLLRLGEQVWR